MVVNLTQKDRLFYGHKYNLMANNRMTVFSEYDADVQLYVVLPPEPDDSYRYSNIQQPTTNNQQSIYFFFSKKRSFRTSSEKISMQKIDF